MQCRGRLDKDTWPMYKRLDIDFKTVVLHEKRAQKERLWQQTPIPRMQLAHDV